jgi:hypothetical protein
MAHRVKKRSVNLAEYFVYGIFVCYFVVRLLLSNCMETDVLKQHILSRRVGGARGGLCTADGTLHDQVNLSSESSFQSRPTVSFQADTKDEMKKISFDENSATASSAVNCGTFSMNGSQEKQVRSKNSTVGKNSEKKKTNRGHLMISKTEKNEDKIGEYTCNESVTFKTPEGMEIAELLSLYVFQCEQAKKRNFSP